MKKFILFVFVVFLLSACEEQRSEVHTSTPPDAEEVLSLNPEADIFMWEDRIYTTGVDWVEVLELTKGEEIGEITLVSPDPKNFNYKNGMANTLPIGAKIYTSKERPDVLLVEHDGHIKKYLGSSEG